MVILMPKCNRCGYEFDPAKPEIPVMEMLLADGRKVVACYKCVCAIGNAKTKEEQNRIIDETIGGEVQ